MAFYGLAFGALAQLGERCLCKAEVTGSSPVRSIYLPPIKPPLVRTNAAGNRSAFVVKYIGLCKGL